MGRVHAWAIFSLSSNSPDPWCLVVTPQSTRNFASLTRYLAKTRAWIPTIGWRYEKIERLDSRGEKKALEAKWETLDGERQPINWLPPQLLIHSFVAFVELGNHNIHWNSDPVYHRAISHVCQQWRSIALSTSHLWSRISYRASNSYCWPSWSVQALSRVISPTVAPGS